MANRYWVSTNTIKTFSIAAQELSPQGLFFKADGTKMYVVGTAGDDVNEYDLSSAWDVSTASYLQNFSVSAEDTSPRAVFFKDDGTKMYILGTGGNDVNEYDLSSAWDVSTASYLQNFSIAAQETAPRGLFFKSDGTKMYIIGSSGDDVNEYDLSSAWDVSTASYLQNFSVAAQEISPTGVFFKPDGTKMYVVGTSGQDVNEYDLSSAWDVSTASYVRNRGVASQPESVFFKDDGTRMFVIGSSLDVVVQYPLSTAWNISTVSPDVWNGTAGTKWATTSGGAGGASVPTTADDVFFDSNSIGTVTISTGNTGAGSINCTGFVGGELSGSASITVAGSITLDAGQSCTYTGVATITGTATLTTAGKTFGSVTVNGSGITVTLGDALTMGNLIVTQGAFDTDNYNLTAAALSSSNANTRTIDFGSSTILFFSNVDLTTTTNLTFNAGTSQLTLGGNLLGGSQTYYNVTVDGSSRQITGANTFNDLTFTPALSGNLRPLTIADNQTVNGTFTCASGGPLYRNFVRSDVLGTARTITANALSATDCDFRDITIAGTAAGSSPTRAGDCGGNSGITFPAAKTVYRVGNFTGWANNNSWSPNSGDIFSANNIYFPLAQDTAVINNGTAASSLSVSPYNVGSVDASARTTAFTLQFGASLTFYGSFTLGSGITTTSSGSQVFSGRGTQTLTSAGKTVTFGVNVTKPAGAFELADAYTSSSSLILTLGTFDANNYNVTCSFFSSSNSNTRTLTMGSGLWTISLAGTTIWNTSTTTGLTFNKDTANILLSNTTASARTFSAGGLSFNVLTIGGATGTSTTSISGVNTFSELASTKTVAHTISFADNQTIDTWSVTGTSGNVVTVNSSSAGTQRTITLTNATSGIDYLDVKDIGVTDANKFYVGANSTDSGNNLNVIFTDAPSGATGNFFMLFN